MTSLYTLDVLRLAAALPDRRRLAAPHGTAEKRSAICGSRVVVDLAFGADGRVADCGMDVRACAFGQASAALFAAHAIGRTPEDLAGARKDLADWLAGTCEDGGDWPGLQALAPARAHPARHAAILLPFDAALLASTSCQLAPVDRDRDAA